MEKSQINSFLKNQVFLCRVLYTFIEAHYRTAAVLQVRGFMRLDIVFYGWTFFTLY